MKKLTTWSIIFIILLAIILLYAYRYAINSPYRIEPEEVKKRIASGDVDVILDVRTGLERNNLGFYPGSLHIPSGELESKVDEAIPVKSTRIIVYCNTGQRARAAVEKLRKLGYMDVAYISGSYKSIM
jgi:phage shock protein E